MTFTLRPYQTAAADAGAEYLLSKRKKNGIMVLPTGAGKSLVLSAIAQRVDRPLVVLQPGKEILQQNLDKFHDYDLDPAVFSASMGRREIGEITLATIGSVIKEAGSFEGCLWILDECHLADAKRNARGEAKMYWSFFQQLGMKGLGLTGTPYRLASNSEGSELRFLTRQTPRIFSDMVYWVQNKDLFDQGYLAKLEYYHVPFKRAMIKLNSQASDYDKKSLQIHLWEKHWTAKAEPNVKLNYVEKVVEVANRALAAGRRHILVFTSNVEESNYLATRLDSCAVVSAKTPPTERQDVLKDFKSGAIKVVSNCAVLCHGYDFPALDCVIDAAPTMSLSRYSQKIGRGARVSPEKEITWVIDMADTYGLYGRVEDLTLYCKGERGWGLWGRPGGPDKKEQQLTNVPLTSGKTFCNRCPSANVFPYRHKDTKNSALLSRATTGDTPTITLRKIDNKTYWAYPQEGDEDFGKETHVLHRSICQGGV